MRFSKISALFLACGVSALALTAARAEPDEQMGPEARIERMCAKQGDSEKMAEMQAKRLDKISERMKLTDTQKAAFKDLQDARAKARADRKAAICANKPELSTFEKKIEFHLAMAQRHLDDLKALTPKLIAFRNTLDDKQKEQFDHVVHHMMGGGEGHHHEH
jgi:hypothetical protein